MPFHRWKQLHLFLLTIVTIAFACPLQGAEDWQPVTPEELKMTSEPAAPGAPAIYLYRQVDRDDQGSQEYNYKRIKILTEEGRKYADIELEYVKDRENIKGIQARTIRPDGSFVNFDAKIYDKTIIKGRGVKYLAKTFTLPDVNVGSIIEYRYTVDLNNNYIFDSHWILNQDLFTKQAKFSLKYSNAMALQWSWPMGLPPGTPAPIRQGNVIRLETQNVQAFQSEDYMPPENQLKMRIDFVYTQGSPTDPEKFWQSEGKLLYGLIEEFAGKRKAMEVAVSQIISPNDLPDQKLQKIYSRVQQIRNLSFESEKTDQEQKRENLKDLGNVEDVWKRGYGRGNEINWLFLALARAAGFEAYPVLASGRNEYIFDPKMMNARQLNSTLVLVKLKGMDFYADPGTALAPYGLLPWPETQVMGLRVDKNGGSWVRTTLPAASDSRIERSARLNLTDSGDLEGKLTVTFTGLEALWMRLDERDDDDAARRKFIEDEVKHFTPAGIQLDLTNKPGWKSSAPALVAEFDVKFPGWASYAGKRTLIPVGLFSETEKHLFEHSERLHPIYFTFPYQNIDDVSIELPTGWQISSLPPEQKYDAQAAGYSLAAEDKNGVLHLTRKVTVDMVLLDTKYYGALQKFFQAVRTGDDQQMVVVPGAKSAGN